MPARTAPRAPAAQRRPGPARPARGNQARAFLDLGALLTAPGCARAWTREILWEWGAAELEEAAQLVASELVTNSVNACAGVDGAAIRLVLTLDRGELAVLVRDEHPGAPAPAQPAADDEGGRGLLIVEHLSDRCGWYPLEGERPAKVTWAVISAPGHPNGGQHGRQGDSGLPGAGLPSAGQQAPALPSRPRRAPPPPGGMRVPRLIDLQILARVKGALERL